MEEVKFNKFIEMPDNKKQKRATASNRKQPDKRQAPRKNSEELYRNQINKAMEFAGGKYVKFDDIDHTEGLLVGGVKMNNAFLFAVMDRDKNMRYVTPDNHFSVIREVTTQLYILDYVYKQSPQYLYDRALDFFEHDKAELFTNCYINKNRGKASKKTR